MVSGRPIWLGRDLDGAVDVAGAVCVRPGFAVAGILRAAGAELQQQLAAQGTCGARALENLARSLVVVHADHHDAGRRDGLRGIGGEGGAFAHQGLGLGGRAVPHADLVAGPQQQLRQRGAHLAEPDDGQLAHSFTPGLVGVQRIGRYNPIDQVPT